MKRRLLTVEEVDKLIQLGWMEYIYSSKNSAILSSKAEKYFSVRCGGSFSLKKLKSLKGKLFEYIKDNRDRYSLSSGFVVFNYKFYCFWESILGKKEKINFEDIEL